MSTSQAFYIGAADSLRPKFIEAYRAAAEMVQDDGGCQVFVKPANGRNADQNARMWAMLGDVSRQVDWYGQKLLPAEWKDVFTAALKRLKVVPGLDGGFVVVGSSTSQMSRRTMSDLIELMFAFAAEHGVYWSDPILKQQQQLAPRSIRSISHQAATETA